MRPVAVALIVAAVALAGCLSASPDPTGDVDEQLDNETENVTEYELPDDLSGYEEVASAEPNGGGTGLWIDDTDDTLYAARGGAGLYVYDVDDPQHPVKLGNISDVYGRDVDVMHHDNRTFALLAAGGNGIHVVDVTDPTAPELVANATEWSSHNLAVVPGTPYVYDSTAVGTQAKVDGSAVIPILDLSDPEEPEWLTTPIPRQVNGVPTQSDGCHDVVVRVDLGQAYCAGGGSMYAEGGGETFIWDIADDPTSPEWVGVVDNPSIVYHHQALASQDGDTLLINDEYIGPNCHGVDEGPAGGVHQTTAAVWIYDISDPMAPVLQSKVQSSRNQVDPDANCGSHFGDLVDGRDAATWGWYQGGSLLIDFSDPMDPETVDRETGVGGVWETSYHNGHAFANGGSGVQVLQLV